MIKIKNISKSIGNKTIFENITFDIQKGNVISIAGPSGVGKTTLLRCIKGLDAIDSGEVLLNINNTFINLLGNTYQLEQNKIGYVFQDLYLFPNFTVYENIDLPLKLVLRLSEIERKEIIANLTTQLEIDDKLDLYPTQLSGGQQQRVAIARTLALKPMAILFDEPTSALDSFLKVKTFKLIQDLAKQKNLAIVLVTHEIDIAKKYSDAFYTLENGNLIY